MTERTRMQIQVVAWSFLCRVARRTLLGEGEKFRHPGGAWIRVMPLCIQRGQLGCLPEEMFRTCPIRRRPEGRPRTHLRDSAWEPLGVQPNEPEEVGEVVEDGWMDG